MHDRAWMHDKMGLHSEGPEGPRPTPMDTSIGNPRSKGPSKKGNPLLKDIDSSLDVFSYIG